MIGKNNKKLELQQTRRKRKRIRSKQQKEAANLRERKRMKDLNLAFENLRKLMPTLTYEKRFSRLELL
uniref:BHLH domain-containing protein n=1 Tax=Panagrolaimus sp. JU765 TaxID=591449 RepID=A0AC34R0T5_9BILA